MTPTITIVYLIRHRYQRSTSYLITSQRVHVRETVFTVFVRIPGGKRISFHGNAKTRNCSRLLLSSGSHTDSFIGGSLQGFHSSSRILPLPPLVRCHSLARCAATWNRLFFLLSHRRSWRSIPQNSRRLFHAALCMNSGVCRARVTLRVRNNTSPFRSDRLPIPRDMVSA